MHWRRMDGTGTDRAALSPKADGWLLAGEARFMHEGAAWRLEYAVETGVTFETRRATVDGRAGAEDVRLDIERRGGQWFLNREEVPAVEGCVDLDLAFTPATNLLPMRRLALRIGEEADAPAAWLRVPQLDLSPLAQTYKRLGPDAYAYRSGDFTATLHVDAQGFVTQYGDQWTAAQSQESQPH